MLGGLDGLQRAEGRRLHIRFDRLNGKTVTNILLADVLRTN